METQSGARTPLVDPFGRELEEWLRDVPATRTPYVSDLVVPPVTGPVRRPDLVPATEAGEAPVEASAIEPETAVDPVSAVDPAAGDDQAFRRPRDRARHASVCAPSFPEPPERLALRIEELAVQVSAQSGRPTIERIVVLEDEVRRRDEDLARLTAWEATVAHLEDPEVEAAREYARSVFADLLADAADEADRRARAAARRAATGTVTVVPTTVAQNTAPQTTAPLATTAERTAPVLVLPAVAAPVSVTAADALDDDDAADRDEPARLVPSLQAVSPVSANTRPTPLIQPATGPTVIDRDAFAAVLRTHRAETAGTPVVFPAEHAESLEQRTAQAGPESAADAGRPGWWSRTIAAVLRLLGRR